LAFIRRRPDASRVVVADALWLAVVLVSLAFVIAFDWIALFVRYPWLLPLVAALSFPWVEIEIARERVVVRRWIGVVPFGRRETLPATGRFGSVEPFDSDREMLVNYTDSAHHVFCLFPRRLTMALNAEIARVGGAPPSGAPEARVVKDGGE
jgi:hypothetical protein